MAFFELVYVLVFTLIINMIMVLAGILLWYETKLKVYKWLAYIWFGTILDNVFNLAGMYAPSFANSVILYKLAVSFTLSSEIALYIIYRHALKRFTRRIADSFFVSLLFVVIFDIWMTNPKIVYADGFYLLIQAGSDLGNLVNQFLLGLITIGLLYILFEYSRRTLSYYKRDIALAMGVVGTLNILVNTLFKLVGEPHNYALFLAIFDVFKVVVIVLLFLEPTLIAFLPVLIDGIIYMDFLDSQFVYISNKNDPNMDFFKSIKGLTQIYLDELKQKGSIEKEITINNHTVYIFGDCLRFLAIYAKTLPKIAKDIIKREMKALCELITKIKEANEREQARILIETGIRDMLIRKMI